MVCEKTQRVRGESRTCLNPCFNGIWSARIKDFASKNWSTRVLILVLMEYGLRALMGHLLDSKPIACLNPCFNGIWSARRICFPWSPLRPVLILVLMEYGLRERDRRDSKRRPQACLNPCFNGIWSARQCSCGFYYWVRWVLILVLMEYGLRGSNLWRSVCEPFTTEKAAEPENFEGKHVPLSANIQRFFELIV